MRLLLNRYRHYLTIQNGTIVAAFLIALGWTWGTVQTLQKNFAYQQEVDLLRETVELDALRNQNLKFQQEYYRSPEYLELSAREKLGKANPGERLIILPDSRGIVDNVGVSDDQPSTARASNLSQWVRFFFGDKPES